jgi:hypothetical protein
MAMTQPIHGNVQPSSIEQSTYDSLLAAQRFTDIPSNLQARYTYDASNNVEYAGFAARGTATSANEWLLHKYAYDASNNIISRLIAYDSWDNHATTAVYA